MPKRGARAGDFGVRSRQTAIRRRRRMSGYSITAPSEISGLIVWYDFSDASTLFTDTGRTTPVASDADVIKGVTNKAADANHLSEATNGPAYKVNIQNGRSVARFDGTDDILTSTALTQAQPFTVFAAASLSAGSAGNRALWAGTGSFVGLYWANSTPNWLLYGGANATASLVGDTSFHVATALFSGTASEFRKDRSDFGALSPGTTGLVAQTMRISAASMATWDIAELIVYNSAMNGATRSAVEMYLKTRWGTP